MGLTYDTGALLAAEANRRDIWALHARALGRCLFEEFTEARARAAGAACARSKVADVVDASVVVGALARNDLVVTSDPTDLERLAAAFGRRLQLHRI